MLTSLFVLAIFSFRTPAYSVAKEARGKDSDSLELDAFALAIRISPPSIASRPIDSPALP